MWVWGADGLSISDWVFGDEHREITHTLPQTGGSRSPPHSPLPLLLADQPCCWQSSRGVSCVR